MAGWHQTIIIGNVGKDPDMRYTPTNIPVCSFSVAVTERWNDSQSNEKKEKTTWYRVTCWRKLAELANQYIKKGRPIMVVGTVEVRAYKNNAGEAAASLELTASNLQFLGGREEGSASGDDNGNSDYNDFAPPNNMGDIPF
ncbi:MAG: single-stranded DNA-binding protein [Phototrophicales bacterium]|nr:single-stranded DNA-binding protein [Phototrophicales bacterium]